MNVEDVNRIEEGNPKLLKKILKVDSNKLIAAEDQMPENIKDGLDDLGIAVNSTYHAFVITVNTVMHTKTYNYEDSPSSLIEPETWGEDETIAAS